MRIKKMLSLLAATTIVASSFAAFVITASADNVTATYTLNGSEVSNPENFFTHDTSGKFGFNAKFKEASYAGIDFTSGLKMESSTKVMFNVPEAGATVTIVQSDWLSSSVTHGTPKTIKFDGTELDQNDATSGTGCLIYTISSVAAGDHDITRGTGESGLFYVSVEYSGTTPSGDPTPTPIPEGATPTPIPEVATPTPNPNAEKTLNDLTPIPTSVTSLSGDDFDIAFNTYYNAVSANGYLINGGKASAQNISSNQNVKINGNVITGNYLDVKAGTANLTNTAKIFAFKPSADCTIKAYGRYDASKTWLRGFKLVAGENIATSEPVTDDDNSYNLATLSYSAASDECVYIISQDSTVDAYIGLIEFEWGSAPEPVETTEAGYTFKSTIEKLAGQTVTLTIGISDNGVEGVGTADITDKLEGFAGDLMLAVIINEVPEGITITSATIEVD